MSLNNYLVSKVLISLLFMLFSGSSLYAQDKTTTGLNFQQVDACAKDKSLVSERNIERLAIALNRCSRRGIPNKILKGKSFKETVAINKARAITVWIAENMAYDKDKKCNPNISAYDEKNHDVENILKNREIVCEGYATLFKALADKMKLTAVYIDGFAKKDPQKLHAWNAFKTPKRWYLVDATWFDNTEEAVCGEMSFREQMEKKSKLVKTINDATNKEKEVNTYIEDYFMTDPTKFIEKHFPNNPQYQLIKPPIKKEDYLSSK